MLTSLSAKVDYSSYTDGVKYYLASATDAQLINALAGSLLSKAGSNTLVVAQGPSTIALPLYTGAKAKRIPALLI